jgi:hypothetical protein
MCNNALPLAIEEHELMTRLFWGICLALLGCQCQFWEKWENYQHRVVTPINANDNPLDENDTLTMPAESPLQNVYLTRTCTAQPPKDVAHAIAQPMILYRGEIVQMGSFPAQNISNPLQVTLSDKSIAALDPNCLDLNNRIVGIATVVHAVKTFLRPDLLAMDPRLVVDAGTLLLLQRRVEQFTEVLVRPGVSSWVLTATLEKNAQEIEAAKLLSRSRELALEHPEEAAQMIQLLQSHWGTTRLVQAIFPPAPAATNGNTSLPANEQPGNDILPASPNVTHSPEPELPAAAPASP